MANSDIRRDDSELGEWQRLRSGTGETIRVRFYEIPIKGEADANRYAEVDLGKGGKHRLSKVAQEGSDPVYASTSDTSIVLIPRMATKTYELTRGRKKSVFR